VGVVETRDRRPELVRLEVWQGICGRLARVRGLTRGEK